MNSWLGNPARLESPENYQAFLDSVSDNPVNTTDTCRYYRIYYMRRFLPRPYWHLLDFGAYLGANLIHYALMGHKIDGIEAASTCVERFHEEMKQFPDLERKITMHQCLIEDFEPPHLYDAVICGEILVHVIDPIAVLDKAYDCLHPKGQLFVTVPAIPSPVYARFIEGQELVDLVKKAGFRILQTLHEPPPIGAHGYPQNICLGEKI